MGGSGSVSTQIANCVIFSCSAVGSVTMEMVITKTDLTGNDCDAGRYMKLAEDRCNCEPWY